MLNHPSVCTSTLPSTHISPSGYTPPSHWLVHKFHAHHLYFPSTWSIFACTCMSILGHTTLDPPPSSPHLLSWASYHQSLGVLCAQVEWLGWALPFIAVLGAAAHVLLQHHCQMHTLSPAEQAHTYFHPLSSV